MPGRSRLAFLILGTIFCFIAEAAVDPALNPVLQKITALQDKSLESSPELKIVRYHRSQKGAEAYSRFSDFLPKANFSIKRQKDFYEERNVQLRALGIGVFDSSWTIDYQWNLLNYSVIQAGRKTFTEKNLAELEVMNKVREYPIAFNTNLLNYLLTKYKKAAVENSLKKAETGKKEAKLGFELGQKTKLDVLRSEANMVSLDAKKTTYIDEEQNAKSKFIEYSGLDTDELGFLDSLDEIQILDVINTVSLPAPTLQEPVFNKSPLLETLNFEEQINNINLAKITEAQWPDLKIQGSYNNSAESFSESFHQPYRTHSIALVLTIPLFGSGNIVSSGFEDFFAKKQIQYTMAQRKLETQNKLTNTLIKINALETLVSSLALNVSQYEELYRLTSKSYQLGKSTLIELLEVQDNLLDSKISLAQNKIQFYTLSQNYLWQAGIQ
ncbi:MAG: TolC family protein [Bacteriovorax sp.]|jgi:outer membrane protein TolC